MLVYDLRVIGNRLYETRSKRVMTRLEVAEKAGLSDRTYADIERGSVNMRIETFLKICGALNITPNEVLTQEEPTSITEADLAAAINCCSEPERQTALKLLAVYIESLNKK